MKLLQIQSSDKDERGEEKKKVNLILNARKPLYNLY